MPADRTGQFEALQVELTSGGTQRMARKIRLKTKTLLSDLRGGSCGAWSLAGNLKVFSLSGIESQCQDKKPRTTQKPKWSQETALLLCIHKLCPLCRSPYLIDSAALAAPNPSAIPFNPPFVSAPGWPGRDRFLGMHLRDLTKDRWTLSPSPGQSC